MVNPRVRKVLRDVWHHKARTMLVVLAIAIGIIGAGAVLNTWSLLRRVTHEGFLATNPASATIRTDAIDAALLDRVRALPAIRDAAARRTVTGRALVGGAWKSAVLFAASDLTAVRIGTLQPVSGNWPPADGAIAIESSSVEYAGAAIGRALVVQVGGAEQQALGVTGIARDAGLAPGWMEHVVYAFVTPGTLARLGAPASLNLLQIVVVDAALDREAVRRVAYEVKSLVESTGRRVLDVDVPEPGEHIHAAQINSLLYTQGAFGLLALLLSGFLVVNLVTAMLSGQVREIGVMKAIGARGSQLAVMYLGLALVLGLVACLVAIPAAALLGRWYAEFTASLLNFDTTGFSIPGWAIAIQVASGALLPVAAAAFPVARGCRIPVSAALRDFGIDGEGKGNDRWLRMIGGMTRPLLLSLRNAFRRRQRMALTLVTLAMGGAVYLGALNLRASIRNSVGYTFGEILRYDLSIGFARSYPADSIEATVTRVEGVSRVEAWSGHRAAIARPEGMLGNAFPLGALPAGSRMAAFPVDSGRWLAAGDSNGLVVNRSVLRGERGMSIGGEVTLVVDGKSSRWTIIGVVESGPGPMAFATREAVARATGDDRMDRAVIVASLRGPAQQAELSRRLREELQNRGFEVGSSQLMAESRRVLEDHLLLVAGFLMIMSQAMIVVGGLGLASTMSLSVLERTREIGVLRAIGARHGSILSMVQIEGLVISVASWALAIPLSVPMSVILGNAFGRIMMPVRIVTLVPEPSGMLLWFAVVVVVSLLACAWPAYRATRVTTAAALAYE
jgi:putative ABC transport system permease protein